MGIYLGKNYVDWIDTMKVLQKCAVVNSKGEIIALKRRMEDKSRPGKWDLPGGNLDPEDIERWKDKSGRGDENDILVRSVTREVDEETGLKVIEGSVKSIYAASGVNDKKKMFVIGIGYQALVEDGEVKLSFEHQDYKWVSLEEMKKLDVGDDGGFIKGILQRVSL